MEYPTINELIKSSKNKNVRNLYTRKYEFRKGHQLRSNLVNGEYGDLLADSHNNLNRWKNYFSQLLNVHSFSDVRQGEIHTAKPFVPHPSPLEVGSCYRKNGKV
jgi:hypothetical protein